MKNINILFVDDDEVVLTTTKLCLKATNINIILANTAAKCLELLEKDDHYDVILLDFMLPDMDGFSLLKQIKQNPDWNKIPVIVQTGRVDVKTSLITKLGAKIIFKPYSKKDLLKELGKLGLNL